MLNTYPLHKKANLILFKEFSTIQFHDYFDGLIGIDILNQLEAIVDIPKQSLNTQTFNIQIELESKIVPTVHTIEEESKKIIPITVNLKNGTFYLNPPSFLKKYLYQADFILRRIIIRSR